MSDQPANPTDPMNSQASNQPVAAPTASTPAPDYVGSYVPPVSPASTQMSAPTVPAVPTVPSIPSPDKSTPPEAANSISQALEDQNIFHLLGVIDGTDEEKEAFLDELQQVIWEDFVENDVELLITEDEMVQFRQLLDKEYQDEAQKQEDMIIFLEKLIPDLEEIMLEKALELKEDMVRERIAGMREYYVNNADALQKLTEAEQLVGSDQWRRAADVLNQIGR